MMDETHFLSNMAPQVGAGFNRAIWAEVEEWARGVVEKHGLAYILTGPLFLGPSSEPAGHDRTIGANRVAVPTHFYKIVVAKGASGSWQAIAFVLENRAYSKAEAEGLSKFIESIDWVEERTGIDFMPDLPAPEEERLERVASPMWN